MAFRFAAAAVGGLTFGGLGFASSRTAATPAHCIQEKLWDGYESRASYGIPADEIALDVKRELENARHVERTHVAQDEAAGIKKAKSGLTTQLASYKLGEVIPLTEETAIFRFLFDDEDAIFDLPACSTLQAQKKSGANMIEHLQRMYTPVTPNGTKGYFDLLVKKQIHGRMTEHLYSMKVGESLKFRVVCHKLKYLPNVYENVGMIGTGSGITALLQVIRASMACEDDKTKMSLLFANPSDHRVLLKGTLDELVARSAGRFKAYYTVDKVHGPEPWTGYVGHIDRAKIAATMPPPAKKNIILVCGSDQLLNSICGTPLAILKPWSSGHSLQPGAGHGPGNVIDDLGGVLGTLGYSSDHVYRF